MKHLENTHDLRLPAWGPYTKAYMGISHIPDPSLGLRFDLSVFPGFYRGSLQIPNVKWESGYHPWQASSDLSIYTHRHQLEWKDRVYVDITYCELDESARLFRASCVNHTASSQALVLHALASVHFPPWRTNDDRPLRPSVVNSPPETQWIDALDYDDLTYGSPRPTDNLVPDGLFRGEIRSHGFVGGKGLGRGFGSDPKDCVSWSVLIGSDLSDAVLLVRTRLPSSSRTELRLEGLTDTAVTIFGTGTLQITEITVGTLAAGVHRLDLCCQGDTSIELDGFVLCERALVREVKFEEQRWNPVPRLTPGPTAASLRLGYEQFQGVEYGLAWEAGIPCQVREFYTDELDRFMRHTVHHHVRTILHDDKVPSEPERHYTDVFLRPIGLAPQSQREVYGLVCCGTASEVSERLERVDLVSCSSTVRAAQQKLISLDTPQGSSYAFSQERMAATVLSNVVYPVYTKGTYIRHNTPGRWWDSLYTWDSGFIGLGLVELDRERAIDCLNAYLTEPGDPHAAFIHHGSPVPVQFYLLQEIWNRCPDRALLDHFYPRLRQYYMFFSGQLGSSTMRTLQSNLLKTWDYFYNSGGWDDYPPQVAVHRQGLTTTVAPVVTTAQCIRIAKIMQQMAQTLGLTADHEAYARDIGLYTDALQSHAWDAQAGYFAYVMHDENGCPIGPFYHESGENYNRGLDGAYPLVAGICTPEQETRLLGHLQSPDRHWTPIGLSTVDQSAPYYCIDGYWNGAVWMPHQWFFWKTCLDLGKGKFAWQIARTALDLWKREVEASYNCCEHFIVATGRGAGWHHFGGLSSPVLSWYSAYYRPGRLTVGFDVWVEEYRPSCESATLVARLRTIGHPGRTLQVIVCLDPGHRYRATWNGSPCETLDVHPGTFYVSIPCAEDGILEVSSR